MTKPRHQLEYLLLALVFKGFRTLPLDIASWMGGWIARALGPFMGAHKIAQRNLQEVMPELNARQRRFILNEMWENLGRVAAELPHLPDARIHSRVQVEGWENVPEGKQILFFSGHIGNWELLSALPFRRGRKMTLIYRHINNPLVDELVTSIRNTQCTQLVAKGARNMFKLVRAIKEKQSLALLIDQKMNDGISVPFFGRPAMTAPALAELALRFDLPIVPARCLRCKGAHFRIIISPQLEFEKTGDNEADTRNIMLKVNNIVEEWVRETPSQWFWVHRRWPKL